MFLFFFSSRRRHTRCYRDWSSDVCSSDLGWGEPVFDRLEADLAKAMLSLPASKGFDIGSGFDGILLTGTQHNDQIGRASCGKECRTRWSRCDEKEKSQKSSR